MVLWSADGWASSAELPTADTGLGVHAAELHVAELRRDGQQVEFTWRVVATGAWAGENYAVGVA